MATLRMSLAQLLMTDPQVAVSKRGDEKASHRTADESDGFHSAKTDSPTQCSLRGLSPEEVLLVCFERGGFQCARENWSFAALGLVCFPLLPTARAFGRLRASCGLHSYAASRLVARSLVPPHRRNSGSHAHTASRAVGAAEINRGLESDIELLDFGRTEPGCGKNDF